MFARLLRFLFARSRPASQPWTDAELARWRRDQILAEVFDTLSPQAREIMYAEYSDGR